MVKSLFNSQHHSQMRATRLFAVVMLLTCHWVGTPVAAQQPLFIDVEPTIAPLPPESGALNDETLTESPEVAFQLGLVEFRNENYESALDKMVAAESVGPLAVYYQGLAFSKLKRFDDAVDAFESIVSSRGVPESFLLEYGVALVESGHVAEGVERLEAYSVLHPDDQEAQQQLNFARDRLNATASPRGHASLSGHAGYNEPYSEAEQYLRTHSPVDEQNWNLTLLSGFEWDSNVLLTPGFSGLGAGADQNDTRHILALFGDYRWIEEHDLVVGATGSLFNSSHFELNDFNTFNVSGGVYANKALSELLLVGANYQYQHTLVDSQTLADEHRIVLNGTLLEGEIGHLTTYYEYDRNRINADVLISAQERTANVHALGVTQAFYTFEGAGRLFAGYRFALNKARGSDFEFQSNMVTGRVEIPIATSSPWWTNTIIDAEARVFFDKYDNPNSLDFNGRPRDDTRTEVRLGAQRYWTEHLSSRVDYTYINSDSNVENLFGVKFYDYNRHTLSSQLVYDF